MRPGRRRALIALAALALLNLAAYLVYTLPRSIQRRNLGARLAVAGDEVARESEKVAALKGRWSLLSANARDTAEFYRDRVGARRSAMVEVLREIESLAQARGLRVGGQGFKFEPVKGAPLERFAVEMPLRGTYRELVGFVEELERSRHFVTLDEINVRGQESGQAELQVVLSCYFRSGGVKQGT